MRPRRFKVANRVYLLPGGNEDNDLWVQILPTEDEVMGKVMAIRSVYELSDEEREAVAAGANVTLWIVGGAQPPVMLAVTDEPLGKGPYSRWRSDGWPLCPGCGEDELYSPEDPPRVESIVRCYQCQWTPPE